MPDDDFVPDMEKARSDRTATVSIFLGALSCVSVMIWPLFNPCIIIGPMLGILAIAAGWKANKGRPTRDAKGGMLLGLMGIIWMIFTMWAFTMAFGW